MTNRRCSTKTYNPLRGTTTAVTDANNKTTTTQYDPLGRVTKVFKPHTNLAGYTVATSTQTFNDIVSTGTPVGLTGDDVRQQVTLPFAFTFYGQSYSSAWLSTNGVVSFTGGGADDSTPKPLPDPGAPNAALYPFWDDLVIDSSSTMVSQTTGTAPNRAYTVEWSNAYLFGRSTRVTFSVTLNENGTIVYNYKDIDANGHDQGSEATVGVENASGSIATQFAYQQTLLATNKAITFTPGSTGTTVPDLEYAYTLRSSGGPNAVLVKTLGPANNQITSYQLYDGMLRQRQTQQPSVGTSGGRLISDVQYDNRGLAAKQATFWNSSAPADTLAAFNDSDIDMRSVTAYDNLERPIRTEQWYRTTTKLWQTQEQYDGDRQTVIPPDGGATVTVSDVAGRTTALDRYPTGSPTGTSENTLYTYDRLGQLTSVADPAANQTTYGYDLLGRRTSTVDPDAGSSTNAYDAAGEVTSATDGRGQKISHEYDPLGREITRWAGDISTGTRLATFTYDTVAKGQPTSATRWVGSDSYTVQVGGYSDQYQPTSQTWTVPMIQGALAGSYQISYGYDLVGNLASTTYPAGAGLPAETVTNSYTALNAPDTTTGLSAYVTSTSFNGNGKMTQQVNGPATSAAELIRTYSFDPATMRLSGITSQLPDQAHAGQFLTVQNDAYSYTATGDITSITDGTDNQAQCYRYDGQHRLTDAWTAASCAANPTTAAITGSGKYPYWDTYTFDSAGRRTTDIHRTTATASITRTDHYPAAGSARIHAATSVDYTGSVTRTDSMTYDLAGNTHQRTINGVVTDFTYNTEGQFAAATVHASGGDQQTTHLYSANGDLLIRKDPGGTTLYAAGQEYKAVGSTVTATRYYTAGGATVAVRNPTGCFWLAADHQASANLTINTTTAAVQRRWYTPYGDDRATQGTWPTDRGFLDKQQNSSTGLLDVGAREYDPNLGVFLSPDPLLAPTNPDTFNAYAYSGHNPITRSDPTGLRNEQPNDNLGIWIPNQDTTCVHSTCRPDGLVRCETQSASCAATVRRNPGPGVNTKPAVLGGCKSQWCAKQALQCSGFACESNTTHSVPLGYSSGGLDAAGGPRTTATATAAETFWILVMVTTTTASLVLDTVLIFGGPFTEGPAIGGESTLIYTEEQEYEAAEEEATAASGASSSGASSAPGCSFTPDTPVLMADGETKRIAGVAVGDVVAATKPGGEGTEPEQVTAFHVNQDTDLADLTLVNQSGVIGTLHTTSNHPFWSDTRRLWVNAGDLRPGENLHAPDGLIVYVLVVHKFIGDNPMYSLTISEIHTYYVMAGNTPVLVHNAPCEPLSAPNPVPRVIRNAYEDIRGGAGQQRFNSNGTPDIFTGTHGEPLSVQRQWGGSTVWEVPGARNPDQTRILINPRGQMGYTTDHYKTIQEFSAPHYPDWGW